MGLYLITKLQISLNSNMDNYINVYFNTLKLICQNAKFSERSENTAVYLSYLIVIYLLMCVRDGYRLAVSDARAVDL